METTNDVSELCHIINAKQRELNRIIRAMGLRDKEYINDQDTMLYQALKNSLTEQIQNIIVELEK